MALFSFSSLAQAGPCCCVEDLKLDIDQFGATPGAAHFDDELGWGHSFKAIANFTYQETVEPAQMCRLEWWERSDYYPDVFAESGYLPGVWYDQRVKNPDATWPASGEKFWGTWERDAFKSEAFVKDYPALYPSMEIREDPEGNAPFKIVYHQLQRKLDIEIWVKSTCSQGCAKQSLGWRLEQNLDVSTEKIGTGLLRSQQIQFPMR